MLNFCTLFNSNYLARGMVMYDSLIKNCNSFHLFVFAFDDNTFHYLKKLNLNHLTVISLTEFEDDELLRVKPGRTAAEYCWTCTPSTIRYCLDVYRLDHCTYIDADLLFYSDPETLLLEMGQNSILLTEHRYTSTRDLSERSGKYCVQFISFKNNEKGRKALNWWRDACIEWCYARHEDGKFGDQKYLDDWIERFESVHVLQNLGGGLAPWNVQQYTFELKDGRIIGTEKSSNHSFEAIFYHYHGLKFFKNNLVSLSDEGYTLNRQIKSFFYKPYVKLLLEKEKQINQYNPAMNPNGISNTAPKGPLGIIQLLKFYWYDIKVSPRNIFAPNMKWRIQNHHYHNTRKFSNS